MSGYNGFDILHAGVANFDCVAVKDLSTNVSSNCFAEGWIKPNDVYTHTYIYIQYNKILFKQDYKLKH